MHHDVFAAEESRAAAEWGLGRSPAMLIGGTVAIAIEAELISDALGETAAALGLSPVFGLAFYFVRAA